MSTRSQSPNPKPKPTTSQRARAKNPKTPAAGKEESRAASAGGVMLDKGDSQARAASTPTPAKTSTPPPATPASTKDGSAAGPKRERRRPRKLNRDPAPETTSTPTTPATNTAASNPASTTELEALKSRVRGLEAKVEQLYNLGQQSGARSPRRRGKGRKGSSATTVPTVSSPVEQEPGRVEEIPNEEDDEADEELVRLEGELAVARRDLESYRPRARRSASNEGEYIEEIPRDTPGVEDMANTGDRAVTLTGSYRIPLPSSVSMQDVKTIQSGVSAAQNVARGFLEQRRAARDIQQTQAQSQTPSPSQAKPKAAPSRKASATPSATGPKAKAKQATPTSTAVAKSAVQDDGKQSWSEWFGGYSMAISRAVKNIEAEAAIESQQRAAAGAGPSAKRPAAQSRTASAPSGAASGKTKAGGGGGTAKRPPAKPKAGGLSSEQVHGLMS